MDLAYKHAIAQVCKNGHLVTSDIHDGMQSNHCSLCGEAALWKCENCDAPIRGSATDDGFYIPMGNVPAFCYNCGTPYEWTLRQVQAAKDLADEVEGVDQASIDKAKESFIALASDTPQSAVAAARVTKLINKAGPVVGSAIKDIVVSIATEAVKKTMGL